MILKGHQPWKSPSYLEGSEDWESLRNYGGMFQQATVELPVYPTNLRYLLFFPRSTGRPGSPFATVSEAWRESKSPFCGL